MSIKSLSQFCIVDDSFLKNLKRSFMFGQISYFITKDDDCFSLGLNLSGCLGIGSAEPEFTLTPLKIDVLCQKNVKHIAKGTLHVVALTEDGKIYSWGTNGQGELGIGSKVSKLEPTKVEDVEDVEAVSCGHYFTVIVKSNGEVFATGHNGYGNLGNGTTNGQQSFVKVNGPTDFTGIKEVCCGYGHTVALSSKGEIFSWGSGGQSALGLGSTTNQCQPAKINASNIAKVVCGHYHSLALTKTGELYSWGTNSNGQLGTGNTTVVPSPTRLLLKNIEDVMATEYTTACRTLTNIYIWGKVLDLSILLPKEVLCQTLPEATCLAGFSKLFTPIILSEAPRRTIIEDLENSIDSDETSDVQFDVDGKSIRAHKAILKIRCEYFRKRFNWDLTAISDCNAISDAKETEYLESPIKVDEGIRYEVFRAFLIYLYTDKIELSENDIIDLLKLANFYCQENLKQLCENILRKIVNTDNVVDIYTTSSKHNAKTLEQKCFNFMLENMRKIAVTESYKQLDTEVKDKLTSDYFSKLP